MNLELINKNLKNIADILSLNVGKLNNVGLLNGKTGIVVFFYHYARYTGNNAYEEYAGKLIDEICEEIHKHSQVNYADGLAGFGTGIEYLARNRFISGETDEVLAELDNYIRNCANHQIHHIDSCYGFTGVGHYFVGRLNNPFNANEKDVVNSNKNYLQYIINVLDNSYETYNNVLSVIHFLSNVYPLGINQSKVNAYLNYAIDKLETLVCEDIHFKIYPIIFNPLIVAVTLTEAFEKTGNVLYRDRALYYLNTYEDGFRRRLNDLDNTGCGALKLSLLYRYFGVQYDNSIYLQLSDELLNKALLEGNQTFAINPQQELSLGLFTGYAGAGMAFLTIANNISWDWINLIPFYAANEPKN